MIVTSMHRPRPYNRVRLGFSWGAACLALIYRVHFHSGMPSLHDPLWAPTRHHTTTCAHWPMPFTEELCWQLVSPCRRAPMKQQPELKPERAEAMVYDPDAQTGPYCPAWHQSLPPPSFSSPQPSSAQPVPKRWDDNPLVNMPIKVLFALHQKKALSQPPGAHVSERLALTNYLGALRNPSVTTGVSVLHNFCAYALYHCSASIWMISMQENMYISI